MSETLSLNYADSPPRYNVSWEREGRNVHIVVRGAYSFPRWVRTSGSLAPIAMIACLIVRLLPLKRQPRLQLDLTAESFTIAESGDGLEKPTEQSWPRGEIAELRSNRYSKGLLLRIPGKTNIDLLTDFPQDLITWIGKIVDAALHAPPDDSEAPAER